MIQHEAEILSLLKDILYEDWMSLDDYNFILGKFLKVVSIKQLSFDLNQGIANGYLIEDQIKASKELIKAFIK